MRNLLCLYVCLCACLWTSFVDAENGIHGWLRYAPISCDKACLDALPASIVTSETNTSSPVYVAGQELQQGIRGIFNHSVPISHGHASTTTAGTVVIATVDTCGSTEGILIPDLEQDGFWLDTTGGAIRLLGQNERGALYATLEYLSMLARGNFTPVAYATAPHAPIRWVNEWDNMDGSIERGYAGASIFFENGTVVENLTRAKEYARLLASIRINGIIVNNVNANATLLTRRNMEGLGRIADVLRPYGVQVGISLDFASPQDLGGLRTFDPLDASVIAWWGNVTDRLYRRVPDLAGYLVKASSEGQPGPLTYNRTLAQGANIFARALQRHGEGVLMFRAFVYDHHMNESDWRADRAKAAVDYFQPLDGEFEENVVVQIKYGPIDFQVREPASPLFANLYKTNTAIELQVTQEYLGQQCHLVYLPPLWKTVLDFDLRVEHRISPVRDVISGKTFKRPLGGWTAVVNVGTNTTWLGSHLAMSNLYAYGRLAWNPLDDPVDILQDWIRLTFGFDQHVLDTITRMSMASWPAYENYTGNLGSQTLADILYTHYGPNPASQDNNGWGQWTRADSQSIGMDRTVGNGTGYAGQYPAEVAEMYENIDSTPDDLLLWFHHVNYTHRLRSGKTVIQHFYDAHYAGAETAHEFVAMWESLQDKIDPQRYEEVLARLVYQAGHSIVWRDAITNFYHNLSGIPDQGHRAGYTRIEAESMALTGYEVYTIDPFETASNATAIVTSSNSTTGTAMTELSVASGMYDLAINYFDLYGGASNWTVYRNDEPIGQWTGNQVTGHIPSVYLDGHSATRVTFRDVRFQTGDALTIVGKPDGSEPAPLDYVALHCFNDFMG